MEHTIEVHSDAITVIQTFQFHKLCRNTSFFKGRCTSVNTLRANCFILSSTSEESGRESGIPNHSNISSRNNHIIARRIRKVGIHKTQRTCIGGSQVQFIGHIAGINNSSIYIAVICASQLCGQESSCRETHNCNLVWIYFILCCITSNIADCTGKF